MAVKIRLRRVGRKKQPSYRMVVTESEHPRGGAYLDTVGFYNPQRNPAELRIDLLKIDEWIGRGATLSETTESLVRKARRGGDKTVAVSPMHIAAEPAAVVEPAVVELVEPTPPQPVPAEPAVEAELAAEAEPAEE